MRIAVYHNLPSGGANRRVFETVRRLSRHHEVDLFCPATADREFCDIGPYVGESITFPYRTSRLFQSPFGRLNQAVRLTDLLRMEIVARRAAAAIDSGSYDVVLTHPCAM